MKVLVTGATGFIGRHLVPWLEAEGHSVTALSSKSAPLLRPEYLAQYTQTKFDRIYHLAAYTRAGDFCQRFGGDQWIINQHLNTHILEWWSQQQKQAQLLALGTSVSYPEALNHTEDNYLMDEPQTKFYSYAMGKRMLLAGLQALSQQYNLKFVYGVPSTVYGANYHTDGRNLHFIYDIAFKILQAKHEGKPVTLWGDGHQTRELIHIKDVLLAFESMFRGPENQIYNVSSGEAHTIREFAQMICAHVGYDFSQVHFDVNQYVGARTKILPNDKIRRLTAYQPRVTLDEGLRELVAWCSSQKGYSGAS